MVAAIYCTGCNERFEPAGEAAVCPRCGVEVERASQLSLDDTLLIRHPDDDLSEAHLEIADPYHEPDWLVGKELHVYRCESLLGVGGMGRVYLAHHNDLHRQCALKILSPEMITRDPEYAERFLAEGRSAAALNHPNIVTTHAIGQADGLHFLEMEFVPGRSLQHLVEHEGALPTIRATVLAAAIAEGLAVAHRQGIIHRDLKPDNVLMTHQGVPKIADFGLAKRIVGESDRSAGEALAGTPNFMAPELFQAEPASPASDVYALGVCYYFMLTGKLPFLGGSFSSLMKAVTTQPLPNLRKKNPLISLEMAECLSLLLAKSPANRPRDGIEASQLLRVILGHARDVASLLVEAFQDEPSVTWERRGDGYKLNVVLPDGRRQTLFIEQSDHELTDRLLLIYSICCDAQEAYYEQALRLNSIMPHGGLAIRDIDGRSKFVVVNTYPRATVGAEEIRRSTLEVAFRADHVENLLTGLDQH